MKILVTGALGQLGSDIMELLQKRGISCVGTDVKDMDITAEDQVNEVIGREAPDAVIHCAAYTAVDKAEEERETCELINSMGTKNIAAVCGKNDIKMLYLSTDYVFSGEKELPYEVDDIPDPRSVYGRTKLDGENWVKQYVQRHFIVRISWVFGIHGNNFVNTMLRLGKEKEEMNVVSDQYGSPTNTKDLAKLLCDMIMTDQYGTYHATNEGVCTWAEFAEEIFRLSNMNVKVNHITDKEYNAKAARPSNSRLSKKSLDEQGFCRLPDWKSTLAEYLKEIRN